MSTVPPFLNTPIARDERMFRMSRLRELIARAGRNTWNNWPRRAYDRGSYQHRLEAVEQHLHTALDRAPAGRIRVVSICAGDGRDVINVVDSHSRRGDVTAWLVEADCKSVEAGIARARAAGLDNHVRLIQADATMFATYQDIPRADVLLFCGVWGHVAAEERDSVVAACRALCCQGGSLIWTRGVQFGMARVDEIRGLFRESQWEQAQETITSDKKWVVVTHRLRQPNTSPPSNGRIFHFRTTAG